MRSVSARVLGSALAPAKKSSFDFMTSEVLDANSVAVGTQLPMLVMAAATAGVNV